MSVAKIIEISAESSQSFEDAIRHGLQRAKKTVSGIQGAWIAEQKIRVEEGEIVAYRVNLRVTFELS